MARAIQQESKGGIPMSMQIWKHRINGGEVKVIWAEQGKVGILSLGCVTCDCEDQCAPEPMDLTEFTNDFAYVRAF